MHGLRARAYIAVQYVIPQHGISRLAGRLANCTIPWVKNALIRGFTRIHPIRWEEALGEHPGAYPSFNAFFTRGLKPSARPLDPGEDQVLSPADGCTGQLGAIDGDTLFQAKGQSYSLIALLGGDTTLATHLHGGQYLTVYLSPRDYHRLHMPLSGRLVSMLHIPGALFNVGPLTAAAIPGIYARNERVVTVFDTDCGIMALVLVGATIVGSIATVWHGTVTPPSTKQLRRYDYRDHQPPIELARGAELGRFNLGSTIIALFEPGLVEWRADLTEGSAVQVGQRLGRRA